MKVVEKHLNIYLRTAGITLSVIFLLILIGSSVRSTGAGMGCPDWPKCFGQWVPPTDVSQLPADYQTIYADRGYANTEFNVVKTWTEYFNRLFGVLTGLFVIATFVVSIRLNKYKPQIMFLSLATLILVIIQGWLGGRVVSSNLEAYMITIHLLMAFLIGAVLIHAISLAIVSKEKIKDATKRLTVNVSSRLLIFSLFLLALTLGQTIIGTFVRAEMESLSSAGIANADLTSYGGLYFEFHKHISLLLLVLTLYIAVQWYRINLKFAKTASVVMIASVVLQGITGLLLHFAGFPPVAQALHVLFAFSLFASQIYLLSAFYNMRSVSFVKDLEKNLNYTLA